MKYLTFDDVLIEPQFSDIKSRSEVDLSLNIRGHVMKLPVFSANMETITGASMCKVMHEHGGIGVHHRFMDVNTNDVRFANLLSNDVMSAVSVGLGKEELYRAEALLRVGATMFFLDVAHGAQAQVVEQYFELKRMGCEFLVVGNFGTPSSIFQFCTELGYEPDAVKIGIGPGSVCTTRIKTGVGVPQLSAILNVAHKIAIPIIADGGMRSPGDIAKALAAGANAVMIGGMLAGTDATANNYAFRGSAYKTNEEGYSTSEGASMNISAKGSTADVLNSIEGGLRSAFTYVGARNMQEFFEKAELIEVTTGTSVENGAHYKG